MTGSNTTIAKNPKPRPPNQSDVDLRPKRPGGGGNGFSSDFLNLELPFSPERGTLGRGFDSCFADSLGGVLPGFGGTGGLCVEFSI
jgi:hypothetical protein